MVPRSSLTLAALATAAVPGLDVVDARALGEAGGDDTALVIDSERRRWVVRAPVGAAAGAVLEAEVELLSLLAHHVDDGALPFEIPRPAGFVDLPEGGRAMVHPALPGAPLPMERLTPGPGLAAELGRALAALHELPTSVVEQSGLPVYDPDSYRQRRLAEVDEAARTGHVPARLLRRWERALEDVALWRFRPTVVHGDLTAEHVLTSDDAIMSLFGWGEAKVADPADDLAWLVVAAPAEAVDAILEAYAMRRTEMRDPHLTERAVLAGELAVARWLLHGVRAGLDDVVTDAVDMLAELDEATAPVDDEVPDVPTPDPAPATPEEATTHDGVSDPDAADPTEPDASGPRSAGTHAADTDR